MVEGHTNSVVMEVVACREGLALASDLGLHSFRIASDCANVARSLLGERGSTDTDQLFGRSTSEEGALLERSLSMKDENQMSMLTYSACSTACNCLYLAWLISQPIMFSSHTKPASSTFSRWLISQFSRNEHAD